MKTIPLTQGKEAVCDDEDFEVLNKHKWCAHKHAVSFGYIWYAVRNIRLSDGRYRTLLMHREILSVTDTKQRIDHKNSDGLFNVRSNLRLASNSQNSQNSRKSSSRGTSRFKGVHWSAWGRKRKWVARIFANGHEFYLGSFLTEREAALAYNNAAKAAFDEYAVLNIL